MIKTICLCLYYGFARYLPESSYTIRRPFGWLGLHLRRYLCKHIFLKMGKDTNIERLAWFGKGWGIELGDRSGIGINCHIHPNTKIGKDVMMGPECFMMGVTHKFDRTDIPMIDQGFVEKGIRSQVIIEDDVWIGREVMIMNTRTIKKGSIIAARTVLCRDFPEYSIVGGNPSVLIRNR